jgi:peptide/nickel transport system permease protein
VLAVLLICAVFAPLLAPHDPADISILDKKVPPGETLKFPLGTDFLGRDVLSRLIFGARTSVLISISALATGALVGTVLGVVAGYVGGRVDAVISRFADAALGFPSVLVAMLIVAFLGVGIENIILAVALTVWARFTRMIRGDVLSVKQADFVTLARIGGVDAPTIMWRHVFPNVVNTLLVLTSLQVGQVILLEASLSFLGLGLPPGAPAWGIMVAEGRELILDMWWLSLFPGLSITVVVLAFNFFGDWMRDYLDPKLRRR